MFPSNHLLFLIFLLFCYFFGFSPCHPGWKCGLIFGSILFFVFNSSCYFLTIVDDFFLLHNKEHKLFITLFPKIRLLQALLYDSSVFWLLTLSYSLTLLFILDAPSRSISLSKPSSHLLQNSKTGTNQQGQFMGIWFMQSHRVPCLEGLHTWFYDLL